MPPAVECRRSSGAETINLAAWGKHCWVDACIHGGVWCPDRHKGGVERGILGHESAYAFMRPALGSQAPGCIPQWQCGRGRSQSDGNHCLEKPLFLVCKNTWWWWWQSPNAEMFLCSTGRGSSAVVGPRLGSGTVPTVHLIPSWTFKLPAKSNNNLLTSHGTYSFLLIVAAVYVKGFVLGSCSCNSLPGR